MASKAYPTAMNWKNILASIEEKTVGRAIMDS